MRTTTRATGPALALTLALLVGGCGSDDGSASSASDTSTSTPTSGTTSDSPSGSGATATPVEPVDFGTEPTVKPGYKKAALRASGDGLITMVPTELPEGWETAGGGYGTDPQWWRMEFTAPTGEVVLDQLSGTAADALADAGLTETDPVDLSAWGTGEWSAWDHDGASVLAHDLKGSTVVLQGPDVETVRALAESLLPAEDGGSGQLG